MLISFMSPGMFDKTAEQNRALWQIIITIFQMSNDTFITKTIFG